MKNTKYKLTNNIKHLPSGKYLYQIQALRDVERHGVKKGDLGGWVESEANLAQDGDAWVFGNAWVYDNAWVYGNARVSGNAWVFGSAWVFGNAVVCGGAAPELLQNLKQVVACLEYAVNVLEAPEKSSIRENLALAKQAIAKAEGGE